MITLVVFVIVGVILGVQVAGQRLDDVTVGFTSSSARAARAAADRGRGRRSAQTVTIRQVDEPAGRGSPRGRPSTRS